MSRVLVVGAGVTGLATAWLLRNGLDDENPPTDPPEVTVLEAGERLGGKVRTRDLADARLDVGADAFLARRPEAERLARRLGLGDDLIAPATGDVWLWIRGRLRPLPAGTVLGVPSDLGAIRDAGVLSRQGLRRAAAERRLPARPLHDDVALGTHIARRFGREVADQLVEPLLGGVYAGDVHRLSLESTAAPVWAAAQAGGSLTEGLARHKAKTATDDRPVFLTVAGGLTRMIDALAEGVGDVRTDSAVATIAPDAGGVTVTLSDGSTERADHVVVTTPTFATAPMLSGSLPEASRLLDRMRYASVAVVTLAYDPSVEAQAPRGSGMLVPRTEGRLVKAATWSSRKWPHLAEGDRFLLRASVGRVNDQRHAEMSDDELAHAVAAEVSEAMGLPAPVEALVARWDRGLPQYEVGHRRWVRDVRDAIRVRTPRVHVAGAAFDGVGIAPCIAQAEQVAGTLLGR